MTVFRNVRDDRCRRPALHLYSKPIIKLIFCQRIRDVFVVWKQVGWKIFQQWGASEFFREHCSEKVAMQIASNMSPAFVIEDAMQSGVAKPRRITPRSNSAGEESRSTI